MAVSDSEAETIAEEDEAAVAFALTMTQTDDGVPEFWRWGSGVPAMAMGGAETAMAFRSSGVPDVPGEVTTDGRQALQRSGVPDVLGEAAGDVAAHNDDGGGALVAADVPDVPGESANDDDGGALAPADVPDVPPGEAAGDGADVCVIFDSPPEYEMGSFMGFSEVTRERSRSPVLPLLDDGATAFRCRGGVRAIDGQVLDDDDGGQALDGQQAFRRSGVTVRAEVVIDEARGILAIPSSLLSYLYLQPGINLRTLETLPARADPVEHAAQTVCDLINTPFYIGITENPASRWGQHAYNWDELRVIFVGETSAESSACERRLLQSFGSAFMCHNTSGGGEGASAGRPHFCYVVCRYGCPLLRRRTPVGRRSSLFLL